MAGVALPRRTLRSGKEYSVFDLALGRTFTPPVDFDFGAVIQQRLAEEQTGLATEDEVAHHEDLEDDTSGATPSSTPRTTPQPSPPPPVLSAKQRDKQKSRARRDKKREEARAASTNPALKLVTHKHVNEAKTRPLAADVNTAGLPHSQCSWIGARAAQDLPFEFTDPTPAAKISDGLGGINYTQEEVDTLSGTKGFMYIPWGGQTVSTTAAPRSHFQPWHAAYRTEPGELQNNVANTKLTDELLASEPFLRIAHFTNILFAMWAPLLFAFYTVQMGLLAGWKSMRRNFPGSVFAACTFNFGPQTICAPHLDFANLAWGWCAITALGDFDPDLGGHLILWDLRMVIRFPPGSTILIPSALIRHSNVPIRAHEYRSSFVQYTAGGLFHWVRNGFRTDKNWGKSASAEEKAAHQAEDGRRWEEGLKMYSCIDDL
ncbi:hypothetical protein DFH08DRAFT_828347 [Mycena albidolilacea]|uniref:Uncharacterized protein n=1 Tax=Mycena albidolilacea TaxID=1033008 RepID=A0AAD6YW93_9AGAR|nr:hypothetical protein DFH08DRAFT_828347 [Mycena albidolilacea]